MDVSVAICTYGDQSWIKLAQERAYPSAVAEVGEDNVLCIHEQSLQLARNGALAMCDTEWIIYLDADDELEPGYVKAMLEGAGDLRAPQVRYVTPNGLLRRARMPRVVHHRDHLCEPDCLRSGNWIVIGAMARTQMLRDVGRWQYYSCYEDWELWVRCYKQGYKIEAVPGAIYRAHERPRSRNKGADCRSVHQMIAVKHGLPMP